MWPHTSKKTFPGDRSGRLTATTSCKRPSAMTNIWMLQWSSIKWIDFLKSILVVRAVIISIDCEKVPLYCGLNQQNCSVQLKNCNKLGEQVHLVSYLVCQYFNLRILDKFESFHPRPYSCSTIENLVRNRLGVNVSVLSLPSVSRINK